MSKAKLTVSPVELSQLGLAGELSNVKMGKAQKLGPIIKVEVDVKDPSALFELGKLIGAKSITEEDVKVFNQMKADEANAAASKAAEKTVVKPQTAKK